MKKNSKRIISLISLILVCLSVTMCFCGCNRSEKPANNSSTQVYTDIYGNEYEPPTDNDEEGWFSAELLAEYSAMSFTQPDGTTVVDKPQRNLLYLEGDKNALVSCASYAFKSIYSVNDGVYLPVYSIGDDGVAKISSLNKIDMFSTKTLYPYTDETSVLFIYMSSRRILECKITLESTNDNVFRVSINFSDKTAEYSYLK